MNAIVCVDKNWAIGKNGKLLASIRDDMEYFRDKTLGKVVVMGRRTLDSLPGGRPLVDRENIVLTANKSFERSGVTVCHSMDEVKKEIEKYKSEDVFCIGGGSIYEMMLDMCDRAYVTKVDYAYDADTYFPNLDKSPQWEIEAASEQLTSFDLAFRFYLYKRIDGK